MIGDTPKMPTTRECIAFVLGFAIGCAFILLLLWSVLRAGHVIMGA